MKKSTVDTEFLGLTITATLAILVAVLGWAWVMQSYPQRPTTHERETLATIGPSEESLSTPTLEIKPPTRGPDYVAPSRDGKGFELVCDGLRVQAMGCPPVECNASFEHPSPAVANAVKTAACEASMDPSLVLAVIFVESRGVVGALSSVGARGLMQLMPATAKEVAEKHGIVYYDGIEYDPASAVRLGALYLQELLDRYGGNTEYALTAYHRGPGNVDAILSKYGELPQKVLAAYADLVQAKRQELQEATK